MSGLDQVIADAITGSTNKWAKQRKAEERNQRARFRRRETFRARAWTAVDAIEEHMEAAYLKASAGGRLWANARQIMYAIRPFVQQMTGKELRSGYFTQQLLPNYLEEHPALTSGWKIAYDARGHFREPHTHKTVPLGTIEVGNDLGGKAAEDALLRLATAYPTHGPKGRFGAVLFIEKEGFDQLLADAGIATRFDIAIMSTKGMSVTASRELVERIHLPLLVLHDFDQAGFSIIGTLRRSTRRFTFSRRVDVIDLGLRLEDIEAYGLPGEHQPLTQNRWTLRQNGASDADIAFLEQGQRVELNAFTSDQFVAFIEERLREVGIAKVMPDEATLEAAYRRAYRITLLNNAIDDAEQESTEAAEKADVPADLAERIRKALDDHPELPWDSALAEMVGKQIDEAKDT